jgi:predicted AAA+ superfamily ATPase
MEFKARKITVEQSEPYKEDRLSRKEHIDNVSLLLRTFSTPIVLSINAPWGHGKTTFMEMLHANLLNESCNAIYFSAWETDFASDPLLAFLGEINHTLESLIPIATKFSWICSAPGAW